MSTVFLTSGNQRMAFWLAAIYFSRQCTHISPGTVNIASKSMKRRASRIRFFVPLLFCAGIAVTVAGCAPIAERKDTPVVRTAPKPPHPSPAVNTRSTYVADDAGDALRKWIRPNGSLDRDRVDVINKFIAEKKFNPVPQVTTFLTGATYAEARAELARRLGLIR